MSEQKLQMVVENRKAELMEIASSDLKNYFKNIEVENPQGFWKMTKAQMVEEILNYEKSEMVLKIKNEVEEMENVKNEVVENVVETEVVETEHRTVKPKFIYSCLNPEGEVIKTSNKLSEIIDFAISNGICNGGWVHKSIKENIPVMIGLRKGQTVEDFKPRKSEKYSGNFYKFTKTQIEAPTEDQ